MPNLIRIHTAARSIVTDGMVGKPDRINVALYSLFAYWVIILHSFLLSAKFFQHQLFQKILSEVGPDMGSNFSRHLGRQRINFSRFKGQTLDGVHILINEHLYLRNLLTHTINNLLQKLNNVRSSQYFVVIQIFNIIRIMCEIFTTIPWVLCKIQLFNLKGSKSEVTKIGV